MMIKQGKEGEEGKSHRNSWGGGGRRATEMPPGGGEIRATKIPPWNTVAYQGPVSRRSR